MYLTLLKKKILAGLWLSVLLLAGSMLAYTYFCRQMQQGEMCSGCRVITLIAGGISAVLCAASLTAYVWGYRWWGINRARWRNGRSQTLADEDMTEPSSGFSCRSLVICSLLMVLIGGAAAVYYFKVMAPSAFKCVACGSLSGLDAIAADSPAVINEKKNDGSTLLMSAARLGEREIVEYLIAHDANVNDTDRTGKSALFYSIGQPEIVELLLRAGARPNQTDASGTTALHLAVKRKCIRSCALLLENGADANKQTAKQLPPLFLAIESRFDVYDLLLSNGANAQLTDEAGDSPLHWAARADNVRAVQSLIHIGCDLDKFSLQGWSPLHLAVLYDSQDAVKLLLDAGVSVNIQNQRKQTPLSCAVYEGNRDLVEVLLSRGADVNAVDSRGNTVLHQTLLKEDPVLTDLLVSRGADLDSANDAGITSRGLLSKQNRLSADMSAAYAEKGKW